MDIEDGSFLLKKEECYIFKIREKLSTFISTTPIYGQATAKSTVGRVDVIARLIVDGMKEYEKFDPDEVTSGDMFLEITPITFDVKIKEGQSISQLRFFYGKIEDSIITNLDFIKSVLHNCDSKNDGTLSVDVSNVKLNDGTTDAAAFQAKSKVKTPIELWRNKYKEEDKYPQNKFWNPKPSTDIGNIKSIVIEEDQFYILRSKERISLNDSVCIYCRAMDETLGEMRIHYAGFVHPCFGDKREDHNIGTPLIFEVRGHNVKILLTDGEILARLFFYRMSQNVIKPPDYDKPSDKKDSYNDQELNLSKLFQEKWTSN
jgi:dCTP deaminase